MPRPRFAKLDPAKREAILTAALEAFASHGFEGASYNQIIEKAGISKGAMYYYFDDKEDLYATVVRHELDEVLAELQDFPQVRTAEEFWQALLEMTLRAQAYFVAQPAKVHLLRSVMKLRMEGTSNPVFGELFELSQAFSEQMLRLGQSVGAVRTDIPFDLMTRLVTAVDEVGDYWMLENVDLSNENEMARYGELFLDLLRRMLEPDPKKNAPGY